MSSCLHNLWHVIFNDTMIVQKSVEKQKLYIHHFLTWIYNIHNSETLQWSCSIENISKSNGFTVLSFGSTQVLHTRKQDTWRKLSYPSNKRTVIEKSWKILAFSAIYLSFVFTLTQVSYPSQSWKKRGLNMKWPLLYCLPSLSSKLQAMTGV